MHSLGSLASRGWKRTRASGEDTSGTAGFTLIEMLVVLAIIGIIMSLVGPRVLNYLTSSKERAAEIQIQSFASAIELFYMDVGRYPTNEEGLGILVSNPSHLPFWNGPYLRTKTLPQDPWGKPFTYRVPGHDAPYDISRTATDMSAPFDGKIDLDDSPATGEPHAPPG